jgi:selenocysteine lyase/cysteine desulfurase
LDFSKRNRVVTTGLDFPTVPHHFLALARRGVETVIVPSRDQVTVDMGLLAEAINNNTALVATSRVFFTSGYVQDVAHLADLCHRRGALLLVDDYQATGQLPLDVTATGVDVLLTGGLKWLLGGPGIAYMYVKEEHVREFNPTATGWFAHRDQFDFNPTAMVFKDDARRFEAGTPAVAAVYAGKAGLSLVSELGPHAIRQRTTELTQDLVGQLREGGFNLRIPPRPDLHASITMVEATNPQGIVAELRNRAIVVDARPGGVRISPYFYNNSDDNRHLVGALEEVRQEFPGWFGTRAPV